MHKGWKEIIVTLILGLVFPGIFYGIIDAEIEKDPIIATQEEQSQATVEQVNATYIDVLMDDGTVSNMDLEEYIASVVLREMPASFETEALKAQAVVARTYTLRRLHSGGKHENAAVCTDSACCQAYCTKDEYLSSGGTNELLNKVTGAVDATKGEVLVYNDELIEATYFSCSGGKTEDAQAVWGSDIPYLQSTESPGEEGATHYTDTVSFSTTQFAEQLGLKTKVPSYNWLGAIEYTQGGGIKEIQICGKGYKGTELRKMLGLRSTAFVITIVSDTVTITTKGYGHRVGMSQYGADAMAVNGKTYPEILLHYYKDAKLVQYEE